MIDLKTNKKSELTFKLNVEGSPQEAPKARLVIELQNHSYMAIEGEVFKDKVTVEIPPLKSLREEFLPEKTKCYLEVIIGENYFIPWQNEFNLKEPISVKAEATETEGLKEHEENPTKVSISIDSVTEEVEETPIEEEPNENLKDLMHKQNIDTPEEDKASLEKAEEGIQEVLEEDQDEIQKEEDVIPTTNKEEEVKKNLEVENETVVDDKKIEPKEKYTYNEFLETKISAREYLDNLFN